MKEWRTQYYSLRPESDVLSLALKIAGNPGTGRHQESLCGWGALVFNDFLDKSSEVVEGKGGAGKVSRVEDVYQQGLLSYSAWDKMQGWQIRRHRNKYALHEIHSLKSAHY